MKLIKKRRTEQGDNCSKTENPKMLNEIEELLRVSDRTTKNEKLINGECLEEMAKLPDHSIACVLTDLPYAMTGYKWDSLIDFDKLWKEWKRILKPGGQVILFASGKFVGQVMNSNMKWYKYMWTWVKSNPTNFASAKHQPMRKTEQILVFYNGGGTTYNPQGIKKCVNIRSTAFTPEGFIKNSCFDENKENEKLDEIADTGFADNGRGAGGPQRKNNPYLEKYGKQFSVNGSDGVSCHDNAYYVQEFTNYPCDVLHFKKALGKRNWDNFHPTQKPVELLRYLIRTHTNPGDVVLDCTAGSMSTVCACVMEDRDYVAIEMNDKYFELGKNRVAQYINRKKAELF